LEKLCFSDVSAQQILKFWDEMSWLWVPDPWDHERTVGWGNWSSKMDHSRSILLTWLRNSASPKMTKLSFRDVAWFVHAWTDQISNYLSVLWSGRDCMLWQKCHRYESTGDCVSLWQIKKTTGQVLDGDPATDSVTCKRFDIETGDDGMREEIRYIGTTRMYMTWCALNEIWRNEFVDWNMMDLMESCGQMLNGPL
jgi:hypothetical protein